MCNPPLHVKITQRRVLSPVTCKEYSLSLSFMGMMPYHQTCCTNNNASQSHSNQLLQESISFHSQPSLSSVPSLTTSQSHNQRHRYPPTTPSTTTSHPCIATLKGYNSYISCLALRDKFLYSGSSDKEICSCKHNTFDSEINHEDVIDNKVIAGKGAVKSLVVLTNKIFSAHQDHKIRAWKIDNNENQYQKFTHLATLPTFGDRALRLMVPKNHVKIRRHRKSTWVHHVDTVSALALSSDESLLYSVSWDRTLKIWRTKDFKCLESVWNAHDDAINAITLSNDGDVYTGSADRKIKVWRKKAGDKKHSPIATLEKHNSGVNALALSSEGSLLYSGAGDRSILVWEKEDGRECGGSMVVMGALRGHTRSVLCLAVVGDLVCSGSADKTVRIWRGVEKCYSCLAVLEGHRGPVKCLTVASDFYYPSDTTSSYHLYSGSLDCDIKFWKIFVPIQ